MLIEARDGSDVALKKEGINVVVPTPTAGGFVVLKDSLLPWTTRA